MSAPTDALMERGDDTLQLLRTTLGDRYRVDRRLGRGGMGAVYLAQDLRLDRSVAIKVLPKEFASQHDLRDRFLRETRMAASFSHPNIVPVFSIEEREETLAFAMGYVEGESLAERVKRSGPLSVKELVRLLQDVGYALAYAHGRGVVHRDIKPDNIMLERATGRALLMDFGISRVITAPTATAGLTRVGEVVGTPEFMSPEQASADTLDGRSDLYSLGLVAWFAATGRLAIEGENTQRVLVKQLTEPVPPILEQRADLPRALADAIDRCARKDPAERFANADELVETLDAARIGGPDVPLPIRLFAEEASQSALVLVGGIVMGVLLYIALGVAYEGNLDIILPVVLFAAVVWGRLSQTAQQAQRLARRGFTVGEIQRGLAAVLAERDAERAQLRADPEVVARRRRQIIINISLLVAAFAVSRYVLAYQRVELRPGWYGVKPLGSILLYAVAVTRGLAFIGLVRSPLRRPPGEWLFRWFWTSAPGAVVLRRASRRLGGSAGSPSVRVAGVTGSGAAAVASAPASAAIAAAEAKPTSSSTQRLEQLESRVGALEAWRRSLPPNE